MGFKDTLQRLTESMENLYGLLKEKHRKRLPEKQLGLCVCVCIKTTPGPLPNLIYYTDIEMLVLVQERWKLGIRRITNLVGRNALFKVFVNWFL